MKSLKAAWHWLITSERGNPCPLGTILTFPAVFIFCLLGLALILMCLPVWLPIILIDHKLEQRRMRGFMLTHFVDKKGNGHEQGIRP